MLWKRTIWGSTTVAICFSLGHYFRLKAKKHSSYLNLQKRLTVFRNSLPIPMHIQYHTKHTVAQDTNTNASHKTFVHFHLLQPLPQKHKIHGVLECLMRMIVFDVITLISHWHCCNIKASSGPILDVFSKSLDRKRVSYRNSYKKFCPSQHTQAISSLNWPY